MNQLFEIIGQFHDNIVKKIKSSKALDVIYERLDKITAQMLLDIMARETKPLSLAYLVDLNDSTPLLPQKKLFADESDSIKLLRHYRKKDMIEPLRNRLEAKQKQDAEREETIKKIINAYDFLGTLLAQSTLLNIQDLSDPQLADHIMGVNEIDNVISNFVTEVNKVRNALLDENETTKRINMLRDDLLFQLEFKGLKSARG